MRIVSGDNYIKAYIGKSFIRYKTKTKPKEESKSFILGQSVLGVDKLGTGNNIENASSFILGQSMLGIDKLGESTNTDTSSYFVLGQSKLGVNILK